MTNSTRFLASIKNVDEAASILAAGADIIDIKDPQQGALGAVEHAVAENIVRYIGKRALTSATIGDLPQDAGCLARAMENMQATGVDIIKAGIFADHVATEVLHMFRQFSSRGCRIVLVFFADIHPHSVDFAALAGAGVYGVMLDTSVKTAGSLRTILDDGKLQHFVRQAQAHGLLTGLAGSLSLGDIPALLKMHPDYLGFRSALCNQHQRNGTIDVQAVHNVRAMIPAGDMEKPGERDLALSVN